MQVELAKRALRGTRRTRERQRRLLQHHKRVKRCNERHPVNRAVAPYIRALQQQGEMYAIKVGELKVLAFLEAGIELYCPRRIPPALAEALRVEVYHMRQWAPEEVMNYLTSGNEPGTSTGLLERLEIVQNMFQAIWAIADTLQILLEAEVLE